MGVGDPRFHAALKELAEMHDRKGPCQTTVLDYGHETLSQVPNRKTVDRVLRRPQNKGWPLSYLQAVPRSPLPFMETGQRSKGVRLQPKVVREQRGSLSALWDHEARVSSPARQTGRSLCHLR